MRILAHYQQLSMWRLPPTQRTSIAPRVWIDQKEIQDVAAAFPGVTLSPDQAFDISGATGVPLMLALASNQPWRGHVPGLMDYQAATPFGWTRTVRWSSTCPKAWRAATPSHGMPESRNKRRSEEDTTE